MTCVKKKYIYRKKEREGEGDIRFLFSGTFLIYLELLLLGNRVLSLITARLTALIELYRDNRARITVQTDSRPKIPSERCISGVQHQEKILSRACQPEANRRHLYWIIDFTRRLVSTLMFPRYRSLSTSRPSSIMYNIGDIHSDNRSPVLSLRYE